MLCDGLQRPLCRPHGLGIPARSQDARELQYAKGKFSMQDFIKIAKEQGQGWCEYLGGSG